MPRTTKKQQEPKVKSTGGLLRGDSDEQQEVARRVNQHIGEDKLTALDVALVFAYHRRVIGTAKGPVKTEETVKAARADKLKQRHTRLQEQAIEAQRKLEELEAQLS